MCHVEQGTSCIALNSHVLGAGESREGHESTRFGDFRLVVVCIVIEQAFKIRSLGHTMCSEISDATNCIALNLDIRA